MLVQASRPSIYSTQCWNESSSSVVDLLNYIMSYLIKVEVRNNLTGCKTPGFTPSG